MTTSLAPRQLAQKKAARPLKAKAKASSAYQSVNPYDGRILKTFEQMTAPQLEAAITAAEKCFNTWRETTFAERTLIVAKAAALMRARPDEFARPVTLEMGKRLEESRGEVALSADIIDYYAKHAERFLAPESLKPSSGEAVIESFPFGVLFGVQPWNFPYYQLARFAAPNLMAGNVVMADVRSFQPNRRCAPAPGAIKHYACDGAEEA